MLKKITFIAFIGLLFIGQGVRAQKVFNEGILFQALAKDSKGNAAGERNIYVRVTLKENDPSGPVKYSENFQVFSDANGIFSVVIGHGNQTSGFSGLVGLNWAESIYFLQIEIAIAPTIQGIQWNLENEYRDLGTTQLWSVPYALNSRIANSAITLESVLPPSLGGTGIDNGENTITLEGNLSIIGSGDISFNTNSDTLLTLPSSGTVATLEGEEELLNKTLTNPVITNPEFIGVIEVPYPSGQSENEVINSKYLNEELSKINNEVSKNTSEISSSNSIIE